MFKFGKKINKHLDYLLELVPEKGSVLDLGCGLGANSRFLAEKGFTVTAVDKDREVARELENEFSNVNFVERDVLNFEFGKEEYDLILLINVLHFMKFEDVRRIIEKSLQSLKESGIIYMKVFSKSDPAYSSFAEKAIRIEGEKNTFFSIKSQTYAHFFVEDEIDELFRGQEIMEKNEIEIEDNHPPLGEHKHVSFYVIARKL